MTMRLCGAGMALCDICRTTFIWHSGIPVGTIEHSDYLTPRCEDAGKLFELPPLKEIERHQEKGGLGE